MTLLLQSLASVGILLWLGNTTTSNSIMAENAHDFAAFNSNFENFDFGSDGGTSRQLLTYCTSICGNECTSFCGTRNFRTCCFNFARKKKSLSQTLPPPPTTTDPTDSDLITSTNRLECGINVDPNDDIDRTNLHRLATILTGEGKLPPRRMKIRTLLDPGPNSRTNTQRKHSE